MLRSGESEGHACVHVHPAKTLDLYNFIDSLFVKRVPRHTVDAAVAEAGEPSTVSHGETSPKVEYTRIISSCVSDLQTDKDSFKEFGNFEDTKGHIDDQWQTNQRPQNTKQFLRSNTVAGPDSSGISRKASKIAEGAFTSKRSVSKTLLGRLTSIGRRSVTEKSCSETEEKPESGNLAGKKRMSFIASILRRGKSVKEKTREREKSLQQMGLLRDRGL